MKLLLKCITYYVTWRSALRYACAVMIVMTVIVAAETEVTLNESQNVVCSLADTELSSSLDDCNLHTPSDIPVIASQSELHDGSDQRCLNTWLVL